MPDNQQVVALLAYFAAEGSITRPEVAKLMGKSVGFAAGIHHRDSLLDKEQIGPWPRIDTGRREKRCCQFPLGNPLYDDFRLCGAKRNKNDLVCDEHIGMVWEPEPEESQ